MKDKFAIADAAQKYAAKGQIDRAIAEWEKLLKEGEDANIYNTIGDLYLKKKAKREAIASFSKAAELFREDGFYLKAIALYKKILNISPSEAEALRARGELHTEKGLIGNAIEDFLAAARIYAEEGKKDRALDIYKRILEISPEDITLKLKVADLFFKGGFSREAIKTYTEIASDYLKDGDTDRAREYYLKVINLDPKNVPSLIGLSEIAEKDGDIEQAIKYLEGASSHVPDDTDVLLRHSKLLLKAGKAHEAKGLISRLLEIEPSNIQAKKLLGGLYIKEGLIEKAWGELLPFIDDALTAERWEEALESLEHFRDLNTIAVKRRLASVYKGMGKKEAAVNELINLEGLYEEKGLLQDALHCCKEILSLTPDNEAIIGKLKSLEERLGLVPPPPVKEEKVVEPVETLSPEAFEEKKAEAEFYAQHGFVDEAVKIYEHLLSISPGNKEVEEKLKALRPEAKPEAGPPEELTGILHEFKKGIEKEVEDKDAETHYNLGIAYKEMGLIDDAIREFKLAEKEPGRALQSLSMLASCYMEKGDYLFAIRELKKVAEAMSPDDDGYLDVRYDLAEAYIKNGQYNEALELYTEIHSRSHEFRDVAHKIEAVKALVSKAKGRPRSKRDRVSYI